MDRTFAATAVAALLLVAGGVGAGLLLSGTGAFDEPFRVDPALTQFSAGNATCVADAGPNSTVRSSVADDSTYLTVDRNVSVRGPGAAVANASFERVGLANYTLALETAGGDRRGDCVAGRAAVVPVRATVQVPHSADEPFRVTVVRDDEPVLVVRNGPNALTTEEVG